MIVNSIFYLSHTAVYPCYVKRIISARSALSSANAFNILGKSKDFVEWSWLNSLPNDKSLDWSKLKAFADDKINGTEKWKLVFGRVGNIEGKGEKGDNKRFLLFPQFSQKACFSTSLTHSHTMTPFDASGKRAF